MERFVDIVRKGNDAFARGDYARALFWYGKAVEAGSGDPLRMADLYGNMANLSAATGQFEKAVDYYQEAVQIFRLEEDYGRLGVSFVNIGNVYADQGISGKALHFYKQALLLLEQEERHDDLAVVYGNISLLYLKEGDRAEALSAAEKGIGFAERLKSPARMAEAYHRLARAKGELGESELALRLSEKAGSLYRSLNDELGVAASLFLQAGLCEKNGDIAGAVKRLTEVVAIDEKYQLPKLAENRARLKRLQSLLSDQK